MQGERGFTLLEVIIAFAIAAIALAALTQGAATGLRSTRVAAHTEEALSRARSRLAVIARDPRPGEQRGDDGGGFQWRTLVLPEAAASGPRGGGPQGTGRPVLYSILVEVSWGLDGGTREVALHTSRLGLAAAEAP